MFSKILKKTFIISRDIRKVSGSMTRTGKERREFQNVIRKRVNAKDFLLEKVCNSKIQRPLADLSGITHFEQTIQLAQLLKIVTQMYSTICWLWL